MPLAHFQRPATDEQGNLLQSVQVTVRREGGGLQPLKSDRAGVSPLLNPFTTAGFADIDFYCAGGAYKIDIVAGAYSKTLRYVAIGLAAETDGGRPAGLRFSFNAATAGDSGAGYVLLNNADPSLATALHISETDGDAGVVAALLATWDDSTTAAARGYVTLRSMIQPSIWATYLITAAQSDQGAYRVFTVTYVAGAGTLLADMVLGVEFSRTGDKGDGAGATVVASLAGLKALDEDTIRGAILTDLSRAGTFVYNAADMSAVLAPTSVTSTGVDSGTETITSANHGLQTGHAVRPTTSINGLTAGTTYWIIRVSSNTFRPPPALRTQSPARLSI